MHDMGYQYGVPTAEEERLSAESDKDTLERARRYLRYNSEPPYGRFRLVPVQDFTKDELVRIVALITRKYYALVALVKKMQDVVQD